MSTRSPRSRQPYWLFLIACVGWGVAGGAGCQDRTAFFITVDWDAGALAINQLRFTGTSSGPGPIFGPTLRPQDAGATLPSPQTVRVELPDSLAGQPVVVQVDGLFYGMQDSSGSNEGVVEPGYESDVFVALNRFDAGTDGGDGG
jgi:hypothetical protein